MSGDVAASEYFIKLVVALSEAYKISKRVATIVAHPNLLVNLVYDEQTMFCYNASDNLLSILKLYFIYYKDEQENST
ncbi:MAG: hypothetical protein ACTS8R_04995 [Arsenophonus sp. NC-QC1-MAG3]